MHKEIPLQHDMFSGELVDTRSKKQKRLDEERDRRRWQLRQQEMFSSPEIAQFGVTARPLMPLAPGTKLVLVSEDPRTAEEQARDMEQAAQNKTQPMFGQPIVSQGGITGEANDTSNVSPSAG